MIYICDFFIKHDMYFLRENMITIFNIFFGELEWTDKFALSKYNSNDIH